MASSLAGAATLAIAGRAAAAEPAADPAQRVTPPGAESTVAVVPSAAYPSHREAVAAAIRLSGGLSFLRPGQTVLLKPAVNSENRYPATTDPETVLAVAWLVREAGGVPVVADRTMLLRSTESAFRATGILEAAREARAEVWVLDDRPTVALRHPLAENWANQSIKVYRAVTEVSHVVNLCTPRSHRLGDFTMALKNMVGVVSGQARIPMHGPFSLRERLAEISLVVRPALAVLDGRMGFADGGPDSGDLVRPGFIAVGSDPVAVDAVGLAQLRLAGANATLSQGSIWRLPQLRRAVEIGIGAAGPDHIRLLGPGPEEVARLRVQMA
jgi:uncharacterized protein (DUF362 family)